MIVEYGGGVGPEEVDSGVNVAGFHGAPDLANQEAPPVGGGGVRRSRRRRRGGVIN